MRSGRGVVEPVLLNKNSPLFEVQERYIVHFEGVNYLK